MRIRTALWIIAGIYLLSWVMAFTRLGFRWEAIDVPFHFASGFMLVILALGILNPAKIQNLPKWHSFLFAIGFAAIFSVCWEIIEFLLMYYFPRNELFIDPTVRDTTGDFVTEGLGAILAWFIFHKKH